MDESIMTGHYKNKQSIKGKVINYLFPWKNLKTTILIIVRDKTQYQHSSWVSGFKKRKKKVTSHQ
jgi:hypothetical protein